MKIIHENKTKSFFYFYNYYKIYQKQFKIKFLKLKTTYLHYIMLKLIFINNI